MIDRDNLEEFLELVADRYTAAEIVEVLEDAGILTVQDILAHLEEFIVEGSSKFDV